MGKDVLQKINEARDSGAMVLDLSNSRLTSLPAEIGQLSDLVLLNLNNNQLTSLPFELFQLANLAHLYLGDNQLTSLPSELGQLSSLSWLHLYNNQLTSLPPELFQHANLHANLIELWLNHNHLTSLPPELGQLFRLILLNVRGNPLTELPPSFEGLPDFRSEKLEGDAVTSFLAELRKRDPATSQPYQQDETEPNQRQAWLPDRVTGAEQARARAESEDDAQRCAAYAAHLQAVGAYPEALSYLETTLKILEQNATQPSGTDPRNLAGIHNRLGVLQTSHGHFHGDSTTMRGAMNHYRQALKLLEELQAKTPDPQTEQAMATTERNYGDLFTTAGEQEQKATFYEKAKPYLNSALTTCLKLFGPEHGETAACHNSLGVLYKLLGAYDDAETMLLKALGFYRENRGEGHAITARVLNNLGSLKRAQGDQEAAETYFGQALAIRQKTLGKMHPDTAQSLNNLGVVLKEKGDLAGALECYAQALPILETHLGPDHKNTRVVRNHLERTRLALDGTSPAN